MSRSGAVLLISPESWDHPAVSKHHYARALAERGHRVLFLDPPAPRGARFEVLAVPGEPGIRVVRAPPVAPGLRHLPGGLRRFLERRWLRRLERRAGMPIRTVWSFENSRFYDLRFADHRLKIYHQVDLNQDFHPEEAARSADLCLCTTDAIGRRLRRARPDVHKVHHGTAVVGFPPDPDRYRDRFEPGVRHAVCVGNLDLRYLDVEGLTGLVRAHPEVRFHFVGTCSPENPLRRACDASPNVRWWGRVDHTELPHVLLAADLLLVAYRSDEDRDQLASPHKFMEYLLSGRPIVCSYTAEYADKRHLVAMADRQADLPGVFAEALANLERELAPERVAARVAFALEHTYDRQLARIADLVRRTTGRALAA